MLERLFSKYASDITDDGARRRLYAKYCAKTISLFVFLALCIAFALVIAVCWNMTGEAAQAAFVVYGVTMALWVVSGITALVLWLIFRSSYSAYIRSKG